MTQTLTSAIDTVRGATDPNALRVVSYLRVSTEEQKQGYGVASQARRINAWVEEKGHVPVDVYPDEGVSGRLEVEDRPEGRRLMADARAKRFDVVAVKAGDRIGRTGKAFWKWVWALEEIGIFVALVNADLDNTTPQGRQEMARQQYYAETEYETIRERTQDGINEKVEAGGFPGGIAPYGYRIQDKGKKGASRLVLDTCPDPVMCSASHEVDVLRKAWEIVVVSGRNLRETARHLNAEGLLTRAGKPWTPQNLRGRLLSAMDSEYVYRNPASSGGKTGTKLGRDGLPLYGETTTILLDSVFTANEIGRLQRALKRNGLSRRKDSPRLHPLSTRVIGKCGKHYTGYCKDERGERWYLCTGKNEKYPGAKVCDCSQIDAQALEERVWGEVCKLLGDPDRLKAMAEDWVGLAARSGIDYNARMAELQEQIDGQDAAIAAAIVMAAKEKDAKAAMEKAVAQLKKERAGLAEMLAEVESWKAEADLAGQRAQDLQALAELARERLHSMPPAEQAEVLALLDVRVTLKGEIPRKTPRNDGLAGWFRERNRLVPLLDDDAWEKAQAVLTAAGRLSPAHRGVLAGLLHKARTGVAWGAIPAEFGNWHSVLSRYQRWLKAGTWDALMDALADCDGTPLPSPLPALVVEGRVDPRLLAGVEPAPAETNALMRENQELYPKHGYEVVERRVDGPYDRVHYRKRLD